MRALDGETQIPKEENKGKKQTTRRSSKILFSFELIMKSVCCSCRQIRLIWHSKSSIRRVIKMQMSLGWVSSLGHSIIRIAACQAKSCACLCLHFRLGQKRHQKLFSWENAPKDDQGLGWCSRRAEVDTCTQTSAHMNMHIPEPPESSKRCRCALVFP